MSPNKDKTGGNRQSRLREERAKWLAENAYGLSAEGLIGALMRGECVLSWASVPTKRAADLRQRRSPKAKKVSGASR